MASQEILEILKQGVDVWDEWRIENPDRIPDLREANLDEYFIDGANLDRVDLRKASIKHARFTNASIVDANLQSSILKGTSFEKTNLSKTNFSFADLRESIFKRSDLSNTIMCMSDLRESIFNESSLLSADLRRAMLTRASIIQTSLYDANLRRADLQDAVFLASHLGWANLSMANISNTDLAEADLINANLSEAIAINANFWCANLVSTNFSGANITGSVIYGTARDEWKIEKIRCDYVFLDSQKKKRYPQKGVFGPHEFEKLYKQLPTIEYIFEKGFTCIDPIIMNQVVQNIDERHPEYELKIDSFHSKSKPRAVFTIENEKFANDASSQIKIEYEGKIEALEDRIDIMEKFIKQAVEKPKIIYQIGDKIMGDQFSFKGQKGDVAIAKDNAKIDARVFNNPATEEVYNRIATAIKESEVDGAVKRVAIGNLEKLNQEFEKLAKEIKDLKPDEGRLKKLWERIVECIPKVAEKVPWDKVAEKVFRSL